MTFVLKDRVQETTVTTGTGTVTLLGATQAHQSFGAIGNANTTSYLILSGNGIDWEVGIGTYTLSGTTLSRTTILASSNGGSAISLVGTSLVMCANPANQMQSTGSLFDQLLTNVDGTYNLKRTSGVWSVLAAAGGGGGGSGLFSESLSAVPTSAGLGTLTDSFQTGGSRADTAAGVTITQTDSATNDKLSFSRWAVPGTPYTKKFLLQLTAPNGSPTICSAFVGWTDGTKLSVARIISQGTTTPPQLFVSNYTNSTTFSANLGTGAVPYTLGMMVWVKLADDGTNWTIMISNDGTNFAGQTAWTGTKAAGFLGGAGYTNLCIGVAANGATAIANLRSYA